MATLKRWTGTKWEPLQSATYAARKESALGRLQARLSLRDNAPVRLVFAGSSTTEGTGASAASTRHVNRLGAFIKAAYPGGANNRTRSLSEADAGRAAITSGIEIVNGGIGGTTAADYLTSTTIARIGNLAPAAVVHMIGSNDYATQRAIATYKSDIEAKIAATDAAATPRPVHLLVQSFPRMDVASPAITWAQYGQALRDIAAADPGYRMFIDLSGPFADTGIPTTDPYNLIGTDNIHATDAGHALLADLLREALHLGSLGLAPMTYVADDFNRANGALNGSATSVGARTWSADAAFTISGNAVTSNVNSRALVNDGQKDGVFKLRISSALIGLLMRADANGDGYYVMYSTSAGAWRIGLASGGPSTVSLTGVLAGPAAPAPTTGAPADLEVRANDSSLLVFVNGVQHIAVDRFDYNGTRHGIVTLTTGSIGPVDDFSHASS